MLFMYPIDFDLRAGDKRDDTDELTE